MKPFEQQPENSEPLCVQLYGYLKNRIDDGDYKPGDYLPSESQMISLYGMSRITIRRAISDLESAGYVKKHHGKGTIVLERTPTHMVGGFKPMHAIYSSEENFANVVVYHCIEEASARISEILQIKAGSKVFKLQRISLINGKLSGLSTSYVPYKKEWENIYKEPGSISSLYQRLQENGVEIDYAKETVTVRHPNEEVRHALFLKNSDLVVHTDNITYDKNGVPVEYTDGSMICEYFNYTIIKK